MEFDITKELDVEISAKALKAYSESFQSAFKLENIAIFLDTNVLISYYGMASAEKAKLLSFLRDNRENIYLTHQVQVEFRRNRVKNIESDLFEPLRKIPTSLESAVADSKNKFKQFLSSNKKLLLADYPDEWEKLLKIEENLIQALDIEQLGEELKSKIERTTSDLKDIKVVDELLDTCLVLKKTPKLEDGRISEIIKLYDRLSDNLDNANSSSQQYCVFPGSGDRKNKKDYPYGDFIIYHEILDFVAQNKVNAVFLTHEKSKGDWIGDKMSPHIHYIEHTYAETGQIVYILNAEKPLSLSLENIHGGSKEDLKYREAAVMTIDHDKGFGFIYNDGETVYFNVNSFDDKDDFFNLKRQEYLRFTLKEHDENITAVNCRRQDYSFDDQQFTVHESRVVSIKDRYGFIGNENGNLYFHKLTTDDSCQFSDFKVGSIVECLFGLNFDGDPVVRKIRLKK